jgi:hypothetical protein
MGGLDEWVTTNVGAALTGYSSAYVRQLAGKGRVAARRAGRDWLVSRESLLQHKRHMDRLGSAKHDPWRDDLDGGRKR